LLNPELDSLLREQEKLQGPSLQATPPAEASLALSWVQELQSPESAILGLAVECLMWRFLLGA
jgi:hypothetical protein